MNMVGVLNLCVISFISSGGRPASILGVLGVGIQDIEAMI
jgi:hypothetical protein